VLGDEVPKVADWLAEFRSRPPLVEVVVAAYDLVEPIGDDPVHGMAAGQVGLQLVRYDDPRSSPNRDGEHYVIGVSADGSHTWDHWFVSLTAAQQAITEGAYGVVRIRG
jgi:hypothetical protein